MEAVVTEVDLAATGGNNPCKELRAVLQEAPRVPNEAASLTDSVHIGPIPRHMAPRFPAAAHTRAPAHMASQPL